MLNQQMLSGRWHEVRGKLKQKWGQLTDDELRTFDGNVDQLVGTIQRKTGETRANVERFLDQLSGEAEEAAGELGARVRQGAAQVAEAGSRAAEEVGSRVKHGAEQALDTARHGYESLKSGYEEAERVVQERPGQAVALAFGIGLLAGVTISMFLTRERERSSACSRSSAESFGRQMLDAISNMVPHRA
jgi:uncharacterized protein YjbJ (UPF0337 family)